MKAHVSLYTVQFLIDGLMGIYSLFLHASHGQAISWRHYGPVGSRHLFIAARSQDGSEQCCSLPASFAYEFPVTRVVILPKGISTSRGGRLEL
jgi:hypothetical protein